MRKLSCFGLGLGLLSLAAPAFAHPGHDPASAGFLAGIAHPLLGLDHLLAMLVVGVWAAQAGGRARWFLPASFLALMACGALFALNGHAPPRIEAGIAASLMVLGLLCTMALRLPLSMAMGITGAQDGADLVRACDGFAIVDDGTAPPAHAKGGPRIGIRVGTDLPWRWSVPGNPYVSGPRAIER